MPLNTQVLRNGKTVAFEGGWDGTVLNCFLNASLRETKPELVLAANGQSMEELEKENKIVDLSMAPVYMMGEMMLVIGKGQQTLQRDHTFTSDDGTRTIELKAGDVLKAWRN